MGEVDLPGADGVLYHEVLALLRESEGCGRVNLVDRSLHVPV